MSKIHDTGFGILILWSVGYVVWIDLQSVGFEKFTPYKVRGFSISCDFGLDSTLVSSSGHSQLFNVSQENRRAWYMRACE